MLLFVASLELDGVVCVVCVAGTLEAQYLAKWPRLIRPLKMKYSRHMLRKKMEARDNTA